MKFPIYKLYLRELTSDLSPFLAIADKATIFQVRISIGNFIENVSANVAYDGPMVNNDVRGQG